MTQHQKIDTYIKQYGYIDCITAPTIGITQLATRIKECREQKGMNIEDDWVLKPNGAKYYKRYFYKQINFDDIRENS